jgi:RNA polymerase sigma-70 factor, ECF subfamily
MKNEARSARLPHCFKRHAMNTAITERVLLQRCKAGDQAAFAELIKQSSPAARRAVRTIARNPADVDDVMQETFVKAFQALRSFDQRSKFSTWLTRIAINNALMLLRRQKVKKEISLDGDAEDGIPHLFCLRTTLLIRNKR